MTPGNSTPASTTAPTAPIPAIVWSSHSTPVSARCSSPHAAKATNAMNSRTAATAPRTITRRNAGSDVWAKALMSAASTNERRVLRGPIFSLGLQEWNGQPNDLVRGIPRHQMLATVDDVQIELRRLLFENETAL